MNSEILVLPEGCPIKKSKRNYGRTKYKLKIYECIQNYFTKINSIDLSITDKLKILVKDILLLIKAEAGYLSSTSYKHGQFIGDTCRVAVSLTEPLDKVIDMFFPVNSHMLHFKVGQHKYRLICNDRNYLKDHQCPSFQIKNIAYIPIYAGGDIIGILALANRRDGFTREVLDWIKPLIDIAGNIKLFRRFVDKSILVEKQSIIENITFKNQIITKIIENSDEAIFVINHDGILLVSSNVAINSFKKIHDEVIAVGDNYLQKIYDSKLTSYWMKALHGEKSKEVFDFKTGDSTLIFFDIYFAPIYKDNRIIAAFCSAKNITDMMAQRIQLESATTKAEMAVKSKDEYLSRISHELRTPLNSIQGFAQLLQLYFTDKAPDPKITKYLNYICKGSDNLLRLVNEVLDIAKVDSDDFYMSLERVSVITAINTAVEMMMPLADDKGVQIIVNTDTLNYNIKSDSHRFGQVLINILSNSIKYNRENGTVNISAYETGNYIYVVIEDTGIGIKEKYMADLFTPFNRLGAEGTEIPGTGLGLAYSKKIMGKMCGDLSLSSIEGCGTTVKIKCLRDDSRRSSPVVKDISIKNKDISILYIEDNIDNYELMQSIIIDHISANLISAAQGHRGLELAKAKKPDLIILDIGLPDISGIEVLKRLKADIELQHIPIIVHSADVNPSTIGKITRLGANEYIPKPPDMNILIKTIHKYTT